MGMMPRREIRPVVGLMPTTPFFWAGDMIDPQVSVPTVSGASERAAAAAEPVLEPPASALGPQAQITWPPIEE